jgi:hypothetical protein
VFGDRAPAGLRSAFAAERMMCAHSGLQSRERG